MSRESYLPALDGLRAISIALVVLSHSGLGNVIPGGLGVTVFFFISGFIITRTLLQEQARAGRIEISAFYMRRLLRLMPALVVFLLLCVAAVRYVQGHVPWLDVAAAFFYLQNYWQIFGHPFDGKLLSPMGITWSLAVEEHYYLVFPALFAWLVRVDGCKRALGVFVALCVIVLAWRAHLYAQTGPTAGENMRIYMATDTRIDAILFGAITSLAVWFHPALLRWWQKPWPFYAGAALLLGSLVYRDPAFREVGRFTVQSLALMALFPYAILAPSWVQRLLSTPPMRYVGKISYSLYLQHWLVIVLVDYYLAGQSWWIRAAVFFPLAWLLADLSWRYVERWGLALRHRWQNRQQQPVFSPR